MAEPEKTDEAGEKATFETFEAFLTEQPEAIKALYETTVSGLKSALESERESRKKLSEQVKSLAPQVEKGSELEKRLAETARMLQEAEQREAESSRHAKFIDQAIRPGVNCTNPKAAYALATAEGLFSEQGEPDWEKLRTLAPELFRVAGITAAGATGKVTGDDINALIRRKIGVH